MKRRTMLYFGSFNPIHKGHVALAEYVLNKGLCDMVALVVSPQNPHKTELSLLPELTRFEMAERACAESEYPARIQPSAIEFLLDKPSYTINTLRFLEENNGHDTEFSILMGADNLETLDTWREAETIIGNYKIFVYPRTGYATESRHPNITFLADAPMFDCSSTEIRNALRNGGDVSDMLPRGVLDYIAANGLFGRTDGKTEPLKAEGVEHYRRNEWGAALNSFRSVLELNPDDAETREYVKMIEEILAFRYTDIYNP